MINALSQPGLRAINLQKVRLLERIANANPQLANDIRTLKLDWYSIRNQTAEAASTDVFIYDEIGGSMGVSASRFVQDLNDINTPEIVVRINSPGGLLVDGIAIGSALAQHPSHVITRVDGMAASAASIIAVAGDVCEMMDGSQMMIHDAMITCTVNPREMLELHEWLEAQSENVATLYAKKGGGDAADWRTRMQAETWMFAEEAVNVGLADSIYAGKSKPVMDESQEPDDLESALTNAADYDAALAVLMNRTHRLSNRGYKYLGRNKAPAPIIEMQNSNSDSVIPQPLKNAANTVLSDEEIDRFTAAMAKLRR